MRNIRSLIVVSILAALASSAQSQSADFLEWTPLATLPPNPGQAEQQQTDRSPQAEGRHTGAQPSADVPDMNPECGCSCRHVSGDLLLRVNHRTERKGVRQRLSSRIRVGIGSHAAFHRGCRPALSPR